MEQNAEELLLKVLAKLDKAQSLINEIYKDEQRTNTYSKMKLPNLHESQNAIKAAMQEVNEALGSPGVKRQSYEEAREGHKVTEKHECFGVASITRVSGHHRLAGSMADFLPNAIRLQVSRAVREVDTRSHSDHFYHDGQPIVDFSLSTYQWAELISSLNGVEVPVTLRSVQGVSLEGLPDQVKTPLARVAHSTREEALRTQVETEPEFNAAIAELKKKLEDTKITQKQKAEISQVVKRLEDLVTAPMAAASWAATRLAEDSEACISQAKVEIAASVSSLLSTAGLRALSEKLSIDPSLLTPQLPEKE